VRALLILNEYSRLGRREGARTCSALERAGVRCTGEPSARVDAVVAAGGDGTVTRAIRLVLERDVPLGIVPLGTFNDLARTLGIPSEIERACNAIGAGRTRAVDIGRVNGCYFVNEASIGLSARAARRQTPEIKQRFGALGVVATGLQTLARTRAFSAELRYDGMSERVRTLQITVANSGRFGGIIHREDASIDDGWLDLYSIEPRSVLDAFALARKIIKRDPTSGEGLRTRRAARFAIVTRRPHRISADGEPAGVTPATFEVLAKAVRVLVP